MTKIVLCFVPLVGLIAALFGYAATEAGLHWCYGPISLLALMTIVWLAGHGLYLLFKCSVEDEW